MKSLFKLIYEISICIINLISIFFVVNITLVVFSNDNSNNELLKLLIFQIFFIFLFLVTEIKINYFDKNEKK